MIVYFSGTGNSKYIASLLATQLNDEIIDAGALIKSGDYRAFDSIKPYVFVAPTYAWRLPKVLEAFIKSRTFQGNKKAYFVMTCGGDIGAAGKYNAKLSEEMAFEYMGTAELLMPENYIAMFETPSMDEAMPLIVEAGRATENISKNVAKELPLDKVKISLLGYIESSIVNKLFYKFAITAKPFFATDACISCGACVDSCMLNNVTLVDGKPHWSTSCTHCMACISKCPKSAIEYSTHTEDRYRYVCPMEK